jgi:large conductance mechanosensitive channel
MVRNGRRAATGFFADFQKFIMQGNVVDLAVAVIIGGAFGKIVESFVADIVTPLILKPALSAAGVEDIAKLQSGGIFYGKFLSTVINFLVIALAIFIMIRVLQAAKERFARQEEVAAAEAPPEPTVVALDRLSSVMDRLERKL